MMMIIIIIIIEGYKKLFMKYSDFWDMEAEYLFEIAIVCLRTI
jgi:hypothetical protein